MTGDVARKRSGSTPALRPELNARHHRFLNLVLRHSGVFVGRQYATFAGITHGQKVHDFIARVLAHGYVRPIALGPNGRTRIYHVHHKPLYAAIGDPDNRHRRRLTFEQAIERLLVLDGVLMDPSLTWLGTEREKRAHFGGLSGLDLRDNEYPRLVFGRAPKQTVRYFPDKLPIGHAEYGRTHVFLYPVHAVDLVHFSLFLLRHQQLLHALPFWTVRVLLPRPLARHADSFRWATRAALATPLEPYLRTELLWYFELTSRGGVDEWQRNADRMREARRAFRGPKFIALRRLWQTFGETELYGTTSRVLLDQMERDRGRVECVVAAHDYDYLRSLARLKSPGRADHRGDEPPGRSVPPWEEDDTADDGPSNSSARRGSGDA